MEAVILFALVIGLMFIGVPIAISLGLSSMLILMAFSDASLASIAQTLFEAFHGHYTLLAIPFFILASTFMSTGGVAKRIIRFAIAVVGHFRGGLAIASVFACMMFAALSGSSPATVVAIGTIVIAGMIQVGYTKEFAAGVICNAGTLGILIPPSIVMVVYAAATEVSVGRMFLAGVFPGLLAGLMLMIGIYIAARWKGLPAQPWAGFKEITDSAQDAFWGLFLIFIILGGIYGGVFTPTEAAAVSSIYAAFVAMFIYRDMGPMKELRWYNDSDSPEARNMFRMILRIVVFAIIGFLAVKFVLSLMHAINYFVADQTFAKTLTDIKAPADNAAYALAALGVLYALVRTIIKHGAVTDGSGQNIIVALIMGLKIWGRNLLQIIIYFVPALVHPETKKALFEAGKLTIMLMFIIANALILKHVLTEESIPQLITEAILGAGFGPIMFLVIVNIILLIGGQFMEPSGLLLIVAPLVFPIAIQLGIDPIHLGIIMVVNMEIGMITPPVGLNLFVTAGVAQMSVTDVVKAALPWVGIMFLFLIIVTYVPIISTWLPTIMMGPEIVTR